MTWSFLDLELIVLVDSDIVKSNFKLFYFFVFWSNDRNGPFAVFAEFERMTGNKITIK